MYRLVHIEDSKEDQICISQMLEQISADIEKTFSLTQYTSCESFFRETVPYSFDIAIFDIEMEGLNGIEAARQFREKDKSVIIIFVTSHAGKVFLSFSAEPFEYLVKPISYDHLKDTLERAINKIAAFQNKKFYFSFKGGVFSVPLERIVYFESIKRIIKIVTDTNTYYFYSKLDSIEKDFLFRDFIRCHQSFIVNPDYIRQIQKTDILLTTGDLLPISKGKQGKVKTQFMHYVGNISL